VVAGKARELAEGVAMADEALRSGAALRVLERLVTVSNA
jgi:anthranilate phosphoribosyltransferase